MRQIKATRTGGFDVGQDLIGLAPRSFARKFQVRYFCAQVRFACNTEHFIQSGVNPRVLMAHVTRIDPIVWGNRFG